MSQAYSGGPDGQATRRNAGALWAADRLSLAAAPTFAIMALLVLRGGLLLCSATWDASLLSGMVPMYLLMSAFHSPKENLQHGRLDIKQIERDEAVNPMIIEI